MRRLQIRMPWSGYVAEAVRFWLGLADEDIINASGQLERIVDCVCDRHGVPRNAAELEIYNGLLRLTAGNPSAANIRRENGNP